MGGGEITFGGELNNEQLCGVLCGFGGRGSEPLTQNLCRYVSVLLDGRNKGAQTHPMASSKYADSRLACKPNLFFKLVSSSFSSARLLLLLLLRPQRSPQLSQGCIRFSSTRRAGNRKCVFCFVDRNLGAPDARTHSQLNIK